MDFSRWFFFNIGIILCGFVAIPFDIYLGRVFKRKYEETQWINIAVISNLASSIALILVGVCLSLSSDLHDGYFFFHGFFASICFIGAAVYCGIYSLLILKKGEIFPRYYSIFGFLIAGIDIYFLFTWHPFLEWVVNLSIISWIIIMSSYMLYNKFE